MPRARLIEHAHQCVFVKWIRLNESQDERLKLMFAVPNGVRCSKTQAWFLKQEGMLAGVPDIIFPVPTNEFCGLMIEFKKPKTLTSDKGRVKTHQSNYIALAKKYGWRVEVCYESTVAIELVQSYLKLAVNHE